MSSQLADFVTRFEAAWSSGDFANVRALWHPECHEPWHFPEELDTPLIGWEALDEYLAEANRIITEFAVRVTKPVSKPLGQGLTLFRFSMQWRAQLSDGGAPVGASVQVSGVLRESSAGLKLWHYMEAGPAALPFVRRTYELAAETY